MDITELLKDKVVSVDIKAILTSEEVEKIGAIAQKENCFEFKLDNLAWHRILKKPMHISYEINFINRKESEV